MIRGIIFDLGGTLVWSDRGRMESGDAWSATNFLRSRGFRGSADALWRGILEQRALARQRAPEQGVTQDAIREAAASCGFPLSDDLLAEAERAFFAPELAAVAVIPGMRETVLGVRADVRVALLSNTTSHAYIASIVDRIGLGGRLDPVMTSALCGYRKPHPSGFERVLAAWGLPAGEVLMVGDEPSSDIDGAAALGMQTLWLRADVPRPYPPCNPTWVADSATEVRDRLAALGLLG